MFFCSPVDMSRELNRSEVGVAGGEITTLCLHVNECSHSVILQSVKLHVQHWKLLLPARITAPLPHTTVMTLSLIRPAGKSLFLPRYSGTPSRGSSFVFLLFIFLLHETIWGKQKQPRVLPRWFSEAQERFALAPSPVLWWNVLALILDSSPINLGQRCPTHEAMTVTTRAGLLVLSSTRTTTTTQNLDRTSVDRYNYYVIVVILFLNVLKRVAFGI